MEMTDNEHTTYLANSALIANSDATLTSLELAALEEIRKNIGAKKKALTSARKAVESGNYTIAKCGDFAAQINNLADMLYICFVDGELSEKESSLVLSFAESIGLTKMQTEIMMKEATERVSKMTFNVTCQKCSNNVDAKAKFCPNCGTPISSSTEDSVKTDFEIPSTGHSIEFAESTAAGFPKALEFSKSAPKFETCIRMKKTWYLASWPEDVFSDVILLADALNGIRNRKYYHNGSEEPWDEVFTFVWCIGNREAAYRPIEYCFGKSDKRINPWGCKHVDFEWTEWANWFSYGHFKKSGIIKKKYSWVFNKERIRHEVMTNVHRYRRCPHLRPLLIEAVIKALPEEIEITQSSGWKFSSIYEEVPGSIKVVEVEKSDDYECKNEYYSDGVRPRGLAVLRQVLTKAFAEAKVIDIGINELVK
ncbi:MAG: zinc-ribbon domain-containing protein [Thermodesulfobacteriota bacterium]